MVFLSAVKAQSTRNVSIYRTKSLCKEDEPGRYWAIDCTATKTSINNITQCDARADDPTKSESKVKTILEIDLISLSSAKEKKQSRD